MPNPESGIHPMMEEMAKAAEASAEMKERADRLANPSKYAPTPSPEVLAATRENQAARAPTLKMAPDIVQQAQTGIEALNKGIDVKAEIPTLDPADVHEVLDEKSKDIHGPLVGPETLKAETMESKAPTVRTEATMELKTEQAQTFRTGETAEMHTTTLRKTEGETGLLMDFDSLDNRMNDWLQRIDSVLAKPQEIPEAYHMTLPELEQMKKDIVSVREKVRGELDMDEYAKAKAHAETFKVFVPEEWYKIEARVNEIAESMKGGSTIRQPEAPATQEQGPMATA